MLILLHESHEMSLVIFQHISYSEGQIHIVTGQSTINDVRIHIYWAVRGYQNISIRLKIVCSYKIIVNSGCILIIPEIVTFSTWWSLLILTRAASLLAQCVIIYV